MIYQGINANTSIVGVTSDYAIAHNVSIADSDFIQTSQVSGRALLDVLGPTVTNELFGDPEADLGQTIRLAGQPVRVIGITVAKGGSGFGNQDDQIFVPITTAQTRLIGSRRVGSSISVNTISVAVADASDVDQVQADITALLEERHHVLPGADDFTVQNQADILSTLTTVTNTLTLFLGGIAAISLVVGGIGVMNIMLESVTERTRETASAKPWVHATPIF